MKTLVVYYSLTGNVEFIAKNIARIANADLLSLKTKEEVNPKGLMKIFQGGKQVLMKNEPELLPYDIDVNNYDLIMIGTPVWAWSFAPALRTFFKKTLIRNKKIILFCCHGGGKGKVFQKMKEAQREGNEYIGEIDFREPLKTSPEEAIRKLTAWLMEEMAGIKTEAKVG